MTKLETLNKEEWKCVLELIRSQISVDEDILNEFHCCDFDEGEIKLTEEELKLLKSANKKLLNISKKELIVAYD